MGEVAKEGIMLVEDPERTLNALCDITDIIITKSVFTKAYQKRLARKKPIHAKTSDTHFYLLKIFDLIRPIKKDQYIQTESTNRICASFKNKDEKYKQELRAVIQNSEKAEFFNKFLEKFQNIKLTEKAFLETKEFTRPQLQTLLHWSVYVGWLDTDGTNYWKIQINEKKPTSKEFKNIFLKTYDKLNRTETFMMKKIYIYVHELRNTICAELEISRNTFDELLKQLIDSHEIKIRLHGAPPLFSERQQEMKAFHRGRKVYHYLSIEKPC